MRRVPFVNFGSPTAAGLVLAEPLVLNRPCYGIRIASDSELDQCRIFVDGGSSVYQGYQGAVAPTAPPAALTFLTEVPDGNATSHKISVHRPLHGVINPGGGRVDILVMPTRATLGPTQLGTNAIRAPLLILEILESPEEAMWSPTERAPFDADQTYLVNSATEFVVAVPTFGRRWASVEFESITLAGAGVASLKIEGVRAIYYPVTPTVRSGNLITLSATLAGSQAKEWEGDYDYILLTLDLASGTSAYANLHFRAED